MKYGSWVGEQFIWISANVFSSSVISRFTFSSQFTDLYFLFLALMTDSIIWLWSQHFQRSKLRPSVPWLGRLLGTGNRKSDNWGASLFLFVVFSWFNNLEN